jgi:hypothetical protein
MEKEGSGYFPYFFAWQAWKFFRPLVLDFGPWGQGKLVYKQWGSPHLHFNRHSGCSMKCLIFQCLPNVGVVEAKHVDTILILP